MDRNRHSDEKLLQSRTLNGEACLITVNCFEFSTHTSWKIMQELLLKLKVHSVLFVDMSSDRCNYTSIYLLLCSVEISPLKL